MHFRTVLYPVVSNQKRIIISIQENLFMFSISHHCLGNTITSVKYNTQEETFQFFVRKDFFFQKIGKAEMCVFGNVVVYKITVEGLEQ